MSNIVSFETFGCSTLESSVTGHPLQQYQLTVTEAARTKSNMIISNRDASHAAVLFTVMFDHAEHHVRIFSGALSKKFYEQQGIIDAALRFLRKGGRLDVLVENSVEGGPAGNAFVSALTDMNATIVELRLDSLPNHEKVFEDFCHFLAMDESGYRVELAKDTYEARASFNDPVITKNLIRLFESLRKIVPTPLLEGEYANSIK
jgi:hypothetical protein